MDGCIVISSDSDDGVTSDSSLLVFTPTKRAPSPDRKRTKKQAGPETLVTMSKTPPPSSTSTPTPTPPSLSHLPQNQQSHGHHSSGVNVAGGASSHITVALPCSLPPPLIHMDSTSPLAFSDPPNVNPFYVKFICGNMRVCQGCKGSLKTTDNHVPAPPFDIAAARAETRPFRDTSGNLITPKRATVYHYHCNLRCIQSVEPHFILTSLLIPDDVKSKLTPIHKDHLSTQFNITFH